VLEIIEDYQARALERRPDRLFYAADEFYLMAGRDFPEKGAYDDFPQLENGIGMARSFIEEARQYTRGIRRHLAPAYAVLTGEAGKPIIDRVLEEASLAATKTIVAHNDLFGPRITVTSLLSGADIIGALKEAEPGSARVLIPKTLLRDGKFLDDLTPEDVFCETGTELVPVEPRGAAFLGALLEDERP
jgi:NifB/MoaA-like Fe-S oxidoreductase